MPNSQWVQMTIFNVEERIALNPYRAYEECPICGDGRQMRLVYENEYYGRVVHEDGVLAHSTEPRRVWKGLRRINNPRWEQYHG